MDLETVENTTGGGETAVRLWPMSLGQAAKSAASHVARYALAKKYVTGKNICDIACGVGYGTSLLAAEAKSAVGMDISGEAIDWAKNYFAKDNVRFFQADASADWPVDDRFDVIMTFETMEHVPVPEAFLEQVCGHLADDGVVILSVPNGPRDKRKTDNPHHLHHFTESNLKSLIGKFFSKAEYFSQGYKKNFAHYSSKILRKLRVLKKQPYFVDNFYLEPHLREDRKTWIVIASK